MDGQYDTLTKYGLNDKFYFYEPHVTGGVAKVIIKVHQILRFMDMIDEQLGSGTRTDDDLVEEFIINNHATPYTVPKKSWTNIIKDILGWT